MDNKVLEAVCSCMYWDVANEVEYMDDELKQKIIDYPAYAHLEMQKLQPQSGEDFIEELAGCPETAIKEDKDEV